NLNGPRNPTGALTLGPDGNFYGTTHYGGTGGFGTVFRITPGGLLSVIANLDTSYTGASPVSALALGPDGSLYGTAVGGPKIGGTVFRVTTNGTVTVVASFSPAVWSGSILTNLNGDTPQAGVTLGPDGCFYGTTIEGGTNGGGTIFKVSTDGVLTTLFALGGTNGQSPYANMTVGPDGMLYGTTYVGGTHSAGTVFKVTTNGAFTKLIDFTDANGSNPEGALIVGPDKNLYGTTVNGGPGGDGTVFKLTTNGVLTTIVPFNFLTGASPMAGLSLGPDGFFYGTLSGGSYPTNSGGAVFRVTTNGTLTILANFASTNGYEPQASLTLGPDGNFYGTTPHGGPPSIGAGVVYRFSLRPSTNQIVSIILDAGGVATLSVASTPGSTNRLWVATNANLPLAQWQSIATNIATNGVFQFMDSDTSGKPMKFYRVSTP
ncbi:MAG TPA: choice-of-anchor tandem repeat GloVer-containing protein, partial [Verrucomicrobiae bacterium]|nr:choice-of-anchor tandem repeat GloVer-containing protein [Verrucomicrobiae bacterium]